METVWLFECGSGRPFAFSSDGEKTWFTGDGRPWAWRTDNGWLWWGQLLTSRGASSADILVAFDKWRLRLDLGPGWLL